VSDTEKKLAAAQEKLKQAQQRAANPGENYTSLPATLKASEGPEDKDHPDFQRYPETTTGRRLALARWIADERNPLTARVLVNHLWLRHFGDSLVPDVSDFGRRAPAPLHQDILDTLAVDFMQHGWSLKHLHRQMVLSELYRRGSSIAGADTATLAADADNLFYWRMNPRRMESQLVRDAVLAAAGRIDLRMGGPSIELDQQEASTRRSLYFFHSADQENRFLGMFDNANVLECYRRQESVVPQQALALANSKLVWECAIALGEKYGDLAGPEFAEEAFLSLLGRSPSAAERAAFVESLEKFRASGADSRRARALALQALMNHNDFVTIR
jgi:hypothetical protein